MDNSYRDRIYERYATLMQESDASFNEAAARKVFSANSCFLRRWLPQNKDAPILEVGCGHGKLIYFLQKKGYKNIQGVDLSPEQVELAKQVNTNISEENAVNYLNDHPNSFELIIGIDIIEHFRKEEVFGFLDACYGALRTGGRLILQTPNAESPWGSMLRYYDFTHEVAFTPQSLGKLLELVKFESVKSRQTGPVVHGVVSLLRFLVWKIIWCFLALWNLAETGHLGSCIYTRTFLITGNK